VVEVASFAQNERLKPNLSNDPRFSGGYAECPIGNFENSFIGEQAAEKWVMDNRNNIIVLGDGYRIAAKST
jgi:hypothetical protein